MIAGAPTATSPPSGDVWHYRLLLAKQADLVNTEARVSVQVPDGWRVAGSAAWFRVSGKQVPTSGDGAQVTLATPLKQDVLLDVVLTKA